MNQSVVVIVRGGVIQNVLANTNNLRVIVVDLDDNPNYDLSKVYASYPYEVEEDVP